MRMFRSLALVSACALTFSSCGSTPPPGSAVAEGHRTRQAIKATLDGYYEALETENLDLTSFTSDVVLGLPNGTTVEGEEDVRAFLENTAQRVVAIDVNQTVVEGDYACSMTEYRWTGDVSTPLAICFRVTGGHIAEIRPYFDPRPLLQD